MADTPVPSAQDEAEIRRLADELFATTDLKEWAAARALFVDGLLEVDMTRWPAERRSRSQPIS
jgi:hypothetical protein